MSDAVDKIKVVVRVRKLIEREKEQLKSFTVQDATDIVQKKTSKCWSFDRVYSQLDNNRTVYVDTASEMIESVVNGFNTTIFAYGQTSSGKTHTMHGCAEESGLINMAIEQLFYAVEETPDRQFLMQVSYMEIYNETVIDLLSDPRSRNVGGMKVRENEDGEVFVEGLEQKTVTSPEEIEKYMKLGEKSRHVGETKMNDHSSRSHTIFRITLESINRIEDDDTLEDTEDEGRQVTVSQLNLVDLAGSEKTNQTGTDGVRLKEGCNINKSLSVLGQVIQKLSGGDKPAHVNYRDSKLTRILQNSIGGNAKTAIICTVTPAAMSEDQTVSTLRFASQAKTIQNHAKVNEVLDEKAQINRLKKEMAKLLSELEEQKKVGNNIEMVQEMKEQLEKERSEKEEHIRKNRELQKKVITSSQPAPARKSLLTKNKERRETWCGPAMNWDKRKSFEPHNFTKTLRPLPVLDQHSIIELEEVVIDSSTLSTSNPSFASKRFLNYVSSPKFLTPKRIFNKSERNPNITNSKTLKLKASFLVGGSRDEEIEKDPEHLFDTEKEQEETMSIRSSLSNSENRRLEDLDNEIMEGGISEDLKRLYEMKLREMFELVQEYEAFKLLYVDLGKENARLSTEISIYVMENKRLESINTELEVKVNEMEIKQQEDATNEKNLIEEVNKLQRQSNKVSTTENNYVLEIERIKSNNAELEMKLYEMELQLQEVNERLESTNTVFELSISEIRKEAEKEKAEHDKEVSKILRQLASVQVNYKYLRPQSRVNYSKGSVYCKEEEIEMKNVDSALKNLDVTE